MVGSVISGLFGFAGASKQASATRYAAGLQAQATNRSLDLQERIYEEGRKERAPFRRAGRNALRKVRRGLRGRGQFGRPIEIDLEELAKTPGYEFTRDQALDAATRAQQARGLSLSGNALLDLEQRAGDLASLRYDTERDFRFNERTRKLNALLSMAGLGQVATGQGTAAGSRYADTATNALLTGAYRQGEAAIGGANASAAALTGFGQTAGPAINRFLENQGWNPFGGTGEPAGGTAMSTDWYEVAPSAAYAY